MATRLDDGQANKLTGVANGPISGGAWLQCGSYTSTVTADTQANYQPNRILLQNGASGLTFPAGIALQNTASGTNSYATALTQGLFILPVAQAGNAGLRIAAADNGGGQVANPTAGANGADIVGTQLTAAASGGFAICWVRL